MRKYLWLVVSLVVLAGLGWFGYDYLQIGRESSLQPGQPVIVSPGMPESAEPEPVAPAVGYTVEPFAQNLKVPWSMVFTSPDRILVTERPGRIRVIESGKLQNNPIRTFPEVSTQSEEGLMGMVLDPNYEQNRYVYLCLAYEANGGAVDKVIRVTDNGSSLDQDFVVIDNLPAARFHAGCRVRFGPDGKLYITTGDATQKEKAQDLSFLGGKILRLEPDGNIPTDNPFPNSPVWSYGHRNPQGLDWHPTSGFLVETEHGPSGNDGPGGGDEVNVIQSGKNYGWPVVSHEKTNPEMISPSIVFTPAVAPASGMFYRGSVFPQLTNTFLFGALRGEGIIQVVFDPNSAGQIQSYQKLAGIEVGRIRDIVEGPDGLIYFTTSNQDGRGKPRNGDDTIYRLKPEQN